MKHCAKTNIAFWCATIHSARRPRTLSGRPSLGPYESFPDVLIRRGRRKDVAETSRPNLT